ncbi:NACHT domain-containing protein [Actinomadura bangladeshensis]|uniref:NACHT N-terminal Helical domain-containing protein n=1 Tax=Actinomadura bangladeshensis TaxID=453573 RepID=A0A6L9QUA8_9ACTN|nr:hypothetical protein [Actinomadura bangladeshensis]NEA28512.1 hypothetical protein [Actinomadura bangladeshensis]
MRSQFSYADAVRLLGGSGSPVVAALDRLTGGLLLAATGGGSQLALSLFDAKGELARLSGQLVSGLAERLGGLGRFERTERLQAAHSVIVMTAFFETLHEVELPFEMDELKLDRASQMVSVTGHSESSARLRHLVGILATGPQPEYNVRMLDDIYVGFADALIDYLEALAVWDRLDESQRDGIRSVLREQVPARAVRRYEELLRRLAVDFPEVAFWTNRLQHDATRVQLEELKTGLAGLGRLLDGIASGRAPDDRRLALARGYRRVLDRPIVQSDPADGVVIPALGAAYLNPRFRYGGVVASAPLDQESWWAEVPVRTDFQGFLAGFLTSPQVAERPLLVLGQPGSGKSLLTKVMAARLPAADFLPVRVPLREVPADTDVQSQIEAAVRAATGERLSWPDLARSAGGALPVVLFDGFDELLQATGIGQSDYLEQVARFQEREADQGRPVAVIVTSRTAVADRARIPFSKLAAVKLERFDAAQVAAWLAVWSDHNADRLAGRGLRPLSADAALAQSDLARQPLLLLLLALYDAEDNGVSGTRTGLRESDLYERVFRRFAQREVRKEQPALAGDRLDAAVEAELLRLSVTAFSMFVRGRQWVTEDELSADLAALGLEDAGPSADAGFQQPLTSAQIVAGRFFFVHRSEATVGARRLTTLEFLHATFGEFLIARLVVRELGELAAASALRSRRTTDDRFLAALLSFTPLTGRENIVRLFLGDLAADLGAAEKERIGRVVIDLLQQVDTRDGWNSDGFGPERVGLPHRCAAYSANLVLLAALLRSPVSARELFPTAREPVAEWRRHALLWRSQFTGDGWPGLTRALQIERIRTDDARDLSISVTDRWLPERIDPLWTYDYLRNFREVGWSLEYIEDLHRDSYFVCDASTDVVWHALTPVVEHLDGVGQGATRAFGSAGGQVRSTTNAFLELWCASSDPAEPPLDDLYLALPAVILASRSAGDAVGRNALFLRLLRQVAADRDRLSTETRVELARSFQEHIVMVPWPSDFAARTWYAEAFGDLEDVPPWHTSGT